MNDTLTDALSRALGTAYRIDRELGGGGMSRVFVARDLRLDRDVVVKVLAPELAAGVSAERFTREIATAARLQQANIVPLLSAGVSDGLSYYTMPFVKGESLRSQLAAGNSLTLNDRVSVLRDVARALSYAHGEGVIHRDIKPDNILLSSGAAVVTDFGIAKAISAARTAGSAITASDGALTQLGSGIGTPAYMAPEQAVGEDVDHRADLYAWGIVAYELLSGTHPFAGRTGAAQLIAAQIAEIPKPLHEVSSGVSQELADLVMQCLSKQPAQRPESAALLLSKLSSMNTQSGERVRSARTRSTQFLQIRVLLPVLFAVVAIIGVLFWKSGRAPTEIIRSVVVVPFSNVGDSANTYFAEGVSEEIGTQLARIPGLQVIGRTGVRRYLGTTKTPREIAKELGAAYVLSGSVQWARGSAAGGAVNGDARVRIIPVLLNVQSGLQEWDGAFNESLNDVFMVQAKVAEEVASALSIKLGPAQREVLQRPESNDVAARNAQLMGRRYLRQRGLENLRNAAAQFKQAIARDSTYARAWAGYSEAYGLLPSYFDSIPSERAYAEAKRAALRAVALDSLLPEAHVALARALWSNFELKAALSAINSAIRLDPSSALALQQKYETLMAMGRIDEGDVAIRDAVRLDETVPLLHFEQFVVYVARSHMDSALMAINRAVALDTDKSTYWYGARWAIQAYLGQHEEAIKSCITFGVSDGNCAALTPHTPALPREREKTLAALAAMAGDTLDTPSALPPAVQASIYSGFGMPDATFERLGVALRRRDPNLLSWQYWPTFNQVQNDPRWTALINDFRNR